METETLLYLTIIAAALVVHIVRWVALSRIRELDTQLDKLRAAYLAQVELNHNTNELCATLRRDNERLRGNPKPATKIGRIAP